jgi:DNA-binding protein H-NS
MAKVDIEKLSLEELKAHAKDVQKAIVNFEAKRRNEALAAARAATKEFGFNLEELMVDSPKKSQAKNPPKYVHPENPELTWSGRGRQPGWIKEGLEQGKSLKDFAI